MLPAAFSWFWAALFLWAVFLVRKRLRRSFLRAMILLGLALNVLAGAANGLVIAANGLKMPVETVTSRQWEEAPTFLYDDGDENSLVCRALLLPFGVIDHVRPDDIHLPVGDEERPALAWLDDRHPIRFCERSSVYSLGDALAAVGIAVLMLAGFLLPFAWLARRLRRTPSA